MSEKPISYNTAIAEIEQIVRSMTQDELDVDRLGEQVERATMLINLCKEKLQKAQNKVENAINATTAI